MDFVLQPDEPAAQEISRVLLAQIDKAVAHLAALEADPVEAVHETRKAIKRIRTTLRLLRWAIGNDTFRKENALMNALSDKLAAARDAATLVEATNRLTERVADNPYAEAASPVLVALQARVATQPIGSEETLHELVSGLQRSRKHFEAWAVELASVDLQRSFKRAIRRMARRGRRAYTLAYRDPSDNNFHEWRKRIKDLYYAACLFHLFRPQKLTPFVALLDRMSEELGDEHDFGMLATALHSDPQGLGGAVPAALLLQLIGRCKVDLRTELRQQGKQLYARSPKKMARLVLRKREI